MYGAVEGYYGGTCDLVMEFIAYVLSGVPFMVTASLFQIHLAAKAGAVPSLLFAFVLTGWIGTASLVRTQFYRFKNQEYVMAARTLGARDRRVIWKHIFPNTLGTIITSSVLAIPGVIFSESMLSYLGIINLGSAKSTSLGTLLSDASSLWTTRPHLMLFPALFISLLCHGIVLLFR
jgi:oligopeptide transport system permease protein